MKNKILLGILVVSLVCAWGSVGTAGQIGYSMRSAEEGFGFKPNPNPPSSTVVAVRCHHWPAPGIGHHDWRRRGLSGYPPL